MTAELKRLRRLVALQTQLHNRAVGELQQAQTELHQSRGKLRELTTSFSERDVKIRSALPGILIDDWLHARAEKEIGASVIAHAEVDTERLAQSLSVIVEEERSAYRAKEKTKVLFKNAQERHTQDALWNDQKFLDEVGRLLRRSQSFNSDL